MLDKITRKIFRNEMTISGEHVKKKQVNLEWWSKRKNLGDVLSEVVYEWMLQNEGINPNDKVRKTTHLFGIGSVIGMGNFDAVIWGSGVHTFKTIKDIMSQNRYRKYDIRAVRGPVTESILKTCGYECPQVYGDPAILMKEIYMPCNIKKNIDISAILHIDHTNLQRIEGVHYIDMNTSDYKSVINEIVASKKIISSSLHGIILAETYGVPAIFLADGMKNELLKFYDWYYSTQRMNVYVAETLEEAIQMQPMPLPQLDMMRRNLKETFPYDLWEK